jgi:ABC-type sulfate/molybdate transport systems ATPase subunit
MTALENVAYGVPKTLDRGKRLDRAVAMLTRMHVPHLTERKPPTFSGGEAQRVALARAFAMDPKVLLLDEPFSALDRRVKNALMTETADWVRRESIPTILVTHDAEEARMLGNRLVHIESGRIVESQSAADRAVPPPPGA